FIQPARTCVDGPDAPSGASGSGAPAPPRRAPILGPTRRTDSMSSTRRLIGAGLAGLVAASAIAAPALGSSHREAPAIAFDPSADITNLYAFVSPDKPDTATL